MSFLDAELSRIASIAGDCEKCPIPCCDYCRVQLAWNVVGSAQKEASGIRETVAFNFNLSLIFNRNQDPTAPKFPQTFRNVESLNLGSCELVTNPGIGGGWKSATAGSYSYEKKRLSDSVILDSEDVDLFPRLDAFNLNLDCDCTGTTASIVNLGLEGTPNFPDTMPACWSGLSEPGYSIDNFADCQGSVSRISSNDCAGWDTSSLTENLSLQVTTCTDLAAPLQARAAVVRMRRKDCPSCDNGILFRGRNPIDPNAIA